jgi:Helix-hairpin-helix motif
MSSIPEASAPPLEADARSGRVLVQWILPAGARGLLAAMTIAVALGLACASGSVPGSSSAVIVAAPNLLIDLNTAPPPVLETLPHVGQTLVRQLVAARELRPLTSLEEAASRVRGLGPSTVAQLRPYLRFNNSDPARVESHEGSDPDRTKDKTRASMRKRNRARKPAATTLQPRLAEQRSGSDTYSGIVIANHE